MTPSDLTKGCTLPPQPRTISVVIPHYDDLENLRQCLQAIVGQSLRPDEIILVDNDSPCGLGEVRRQAANINSSIRVIGTSERGAAYARNVGAAASSGTIIAFADGDVRPRADWLEAGVAALLVYPIVGGQVEVSPRVSGAPTAIEAWDVMFGFDAAKFFRRSYHLLTGNLMMTRDVFEHVGGFRQGIPEDFEWCRRAAAAGFPLHYDERVIVVHPALRTWPALKARHMRLTTEAFTWSREHQTGLLRFWFRSLLAILSIGPHGARIVFKMKGAATLKAAALGVLVRIRLIRFTHSQKLLLTLVRWHG